MTKPLSSHALSALGWAAGDKGIPSSQVNAGVCDRLRRDGLVAFVDRPSPYPSHKPGTRVAYMVATPAGLAKLLEKRG